jgi:hypothetical protein
MKRTADARGQASLVAAAPILQIGTGRGVWQMKLVITADDDSLRPQGSILLRRHRINGTQDERRLPAVYKADIP